MERREDIQGLRAVGALLVAVYHIWVGRVSGGVDVFFTISGFLLIGSLARQLEQTGRIRLFAFTMRLAHRLLPASLLVVAVILASGWAWLPRTEWDHSIEEIVASTLYLENWFLAFSAVDYLDRGQPPSPLQHYWAMSAQVQALLLVAGLLWCMGLVARLFRTRPGRRGIGLLLVLVFAASLLYSVLATWRNQPFAYFDTAARLWEFAAGGLVALALPFLKPGARLRLAGGWLGLAAILSCGLLLSVSTQFPGYAALLPVAGCALVLVCGHGETRGANRLLGSAPLAGLGQHAYALYLWHWPALIFFLTVSYRQEPDLKEGFAILLVALSLAWLTTHTLAPLFPRRQSQKPLAVLVSAAGTALLIGYGAFAWNLHKNVLVEREQAVAVSPPSHPGARLLDGEQPTIPADMSPGLLTAKRDKHDLHWDGCLESMAGDALHRCRFGGERAPFRLAIVGGSHSAHWVPALEMALQGMAGWQVETYLKSACPFSTEPIGEDPARRSSCQRWNERVLQKLLRDPPTLVFTTATRTAPPHRSPAEHVPTGYREQWLPLLEAGVAVAAIRDNPRFGFDVPRCLDINGTASAACTLRREQVLADRNPARDLPEASQMHLLDLSRYFCPEKVCPPVIGNVLLYPDQGHITATYMESLGPALARQLIPALVAAERNVPQEDRSPSQLTTR